ncbi:hypothetical protein DOY81_010015, partial [Sarcophaga bullata]
ETQNPTQRHQGGLLSRRLISGAIGPVLCLAQVFAVMPLSGVLSSSSFDLKFSWCSIRTWYSMAVIISFGFCMSITIAFALRGVVNFDSVVVLLEGIVFYSSIFFIAATFFHMTRKWPVLMQQWQQVERGLPPQRTEVERSWLAHKIKMIALVATACSLAGILGKFINLLCTFAWNFNDIFLMCLCVALSAKFRQLNVYMAANLQKTTTPSFWMECRRNYRQLCRLCESVDDTIAAITLLCISNNLYFICNKILKSIQKKPCLTNQNITHTLYFWYSLIFLLGRTFILALYAAEINEESRKPLAIFRKVKRECWCPELKRFSEEVNADLIALTGMKFFHLTRSMVLTVAGTILTYELVLLQFNKEDLIGDCAQE